MAFDFSTLVTDRTQADIAYVKSLIVKLVNETISDQELEIWNSKALKGAYNHTDINRVNSALDSIVSLFESYGYDTKGYQRFEVLREDSSKSKYLVYEDDVLTQEVTQQYLNNVKLVRSLISVLPDTPNVPDTMQKFVFTDANDIEHILVDLNTLLNSMQKVIPHVGQPLFYAGFGLYIATSVTTEDTDESYVADGTLYLASGSVIGHTLSVSGSVSGTTLTV